MERGDIWFDSFDRIGEVDSTYNIDKLRDLEHSYVPISGDIKIIQDLVVDLQNQLVKFATDKSQTLGNLESRILISATNTFLKRNDLGTLNLPFRDLDEFLTYWIDKGLTGYGSWQMRRMELQNLFEPVHERISKLLDSPFENRLVETVHSPKRWAQLHLEVQSLRQTASKAKTHQDFRKVGSDCVAVLETLSAVAFNPERHLIAGEVEPPKDKVIVRLDRVIEIELAGSDNSKLRSLFRASLALSQSSKHNLAGDGIKSVIAADSAIYLVSIFEHLLNPTI